MPASTAFVTDSNRPQPLWQPPPTACLTASGAASEAPSLLMHSWGPLLSMCRRCPPLRHSPGALRPCPRPIAGPGPGGRQRHQGRRGADDAVGVSGGPKRWRARSFLRCPGATLGAGPKAVGCVGVTAAVRCRRASGRPRLLLVTGQPTTARWRGLICPTPFRGSAPTCIPLGPPFNPFTHWGASPQWEQPDFGRGGRGVGGEGQG